MIELAELPLFPQPQRIAFGDPPVKLDRVEIVVANEPSELESLAAVTVQAALADAGVAARIVRAAAADAESRPILVGTCTAHPFLADACPPIEAPVHSDQAYRIEVQAERIIVAGNTPIGVWYAARTFAQLARMATGSQTLPTLTIEDWPELEHRGIYVECRWGPDLMTLEDWQRAIDYLADLKLNVMSIGIYNNWPIQYDGKISEFLMVPVRAFPFLNRPKTITYYSPKSGREERLEYLPRIVTEDFFGEVIAYGRRRGVLVRPHVNTPGHNTLIPRMIPEVSAKDEAGLATGYGFCLTSERTYEVMFTILDEVIDRYLLPNGVDWIHLGLDEVWPWQGMNEEVPLKVINPWCRCPECRQRSDADNFVAYAVRLASHVHEKGINNIGMWYDSFVRGGKMGTELVERFAAAGLSDAVILHWWRYNDFFETTQPELGLKRWVVPMTGYFYWQGYLDHLDNIYTALRVGHAENALGTEAYGVFDRCYDRQYHCLADYAWNAHATHSLGAFREKYVRKLYGEHWHDALEGFRYFDQAVAGAYYNQPSRLFFYYYNYAGSPEHAFIRANYPQALLRDLSSDPAGVLRALTDARSQARRARAIWRDIPARDAQEGGITQIFDLEAERIAVVCDVFLRGTALTKRYLAQAAASAPPIADRERVIAELAQSAAESAALRDELDDLMRAWETLPDAYVIPQSLRELTQMRQFVAALAEQLEDAGRQMAAGQLDALPTLPALACQPVEWIG